MSDQILRPSRKSLIVAGEFKNLKKVLGFVQKAARKSGFSEAENYKIQLAVDEAFSNIIEHAYGGENVGNIECSCEFNNLELVIQLIDFGRPFDPESIETPNLDSTLMDRKTGGLGLYFIHQLMDEVKFFSFPESDPVGRPGFPTQPCNVLVMVKRRSKPT